MPTGTRVHRCVQNVKKKGGRSAVNPYAVCQAATGQSYTTGKSLRSHMPKGVKQSPQGDIGQHRAMEASAASRKLKAGKVDKASSYLPFHPEAMQGDRPGLSVRKADADRVV